MRIYRPRIMCAYPSRGAHPDNTVPSLLLLQDVCAVTSVNVVNVAHYASLYTRLCRFSLLLLSNNSVIKLSLYNGIITWNYNVLLLSKLTFQRGIIRITDKNLLKTDMNWWNSIYVNWADHPINLNWFWLIQITFRFNIFNQAGFNRFNFHFHAEMKRYYQIWCEIDVTFYR